MDRINKVIIVLLGISIIFLGVEFICANTNREVDNKISYQTASMDGEYSIDHQKWKRFKEWEELPQDCEKLYIRGEVEEPISQKEQFIMYICNAQVVMKVDRKKVLEFGMPGTYRFSHGPGFIIWRDTKALVKQHSYLELTVTNPYAKHNGLLFIEPYFLNGRVGHSDALYQKIIQDIPCVLISLLIIATGICSGVISMVLFWGRKKEIHTGLLFSAFMISSGVYTLIADIYQYMPLLIQNPVLCNYLENVPIYFIGIACALYVMMNLKEKKCIRFMQLQSALSCFCTACALVIQLTGKIDLYEMEIGILPVMAIGVLGAVFCISYEGFMKKNTYAKRLLIMMSPYLVMSACSIINIFVGFSPKRCFMKMGIFATALLHILQLLDLFRMQRQEEKHIQKIEREVMESRMIMMQSQIQPHFLYNSLYVIRGLTLTEPQKAYDGITYFSNYLRGNLDSLKSIYAISFEQELEHVYNYLMLENMQFANRFEVVEDYETTDFRVPPLSVQPIVENAIRHGLLKKPDSDMLYLGVKYEKEAIVIIIEDDGIGFDWDLVKNRKDGRSHVGIENVKNRLELIGGNMKITSKLGDGTKVEISIPCKWGENHDTLISCG